MVRLCYLHDFEGGGSEPPSAGRAKPDRMLQSQTNFLRTCNGLGVDCDDSQGRSMHRSARKSKRENNGCWGAGALDVPTHLPAKGRRGGAFPQRNESEHSEAHELLYSCVSMSNVSIDMCLYQLYQSCGLH